MTTPQKTLYGFYSRQQEIATRRKNECGMYPPVNPTAFYRSVPSGMVVEVTEVRSVPEPNPDWPDSEYKGIVAPPPPRTRESIEAAITVAEQELTRVRKLVKTAEQELQALRLERLPFVAKYKVGDRAYYHGQSVEITGVGVSQYGSPLYEFCYVTKAGKRGRRAGTTREEFIDLNPPAPPRFPLILD